MRDGRNASRDLTLVVGVLKSVLDRLTASGSYTGAWNITDYRQFVINPCL